MSLTPRLALVLPLLSITACYRAADSKAPAAPTAATGPTQLTALADSLDGRRWLQRDAEIATSLGAGPLAVVVTDVGADGDRVGSFVAIPNDQCIVAYARGSFGIDDLDLYAYADDGTILAADEAADPHPAISICPPHPGRAYVAARIVSGRGMVSVGVHQVAPFAMANVGRALGAHGRAESVARVEAWPGLTEMISDHRRELGGTWQEMRRVAIEADARAPTRVSTSLEPGHCLDALVVPSDELALLDVAIYDDRDGLVARAAPVGRNRTVVVCSPVQTTVGIEVRPHAGQGLCAVVLARSAGLDTGRDIDGALRIHEVAPTGDLSAARTARSERLKTLGYSEPKTVASGTADVGKRISYPVDLAPGCTRIDLIAGKPLAGVLASLWDPAGNLVAESESGLGPTLFACGAGGHARIDLEATLKPGPFTVDLRRESTAPAALVRHPLGAARLLGALEEQAGSALTAGAGKDAKVVALDPSALGAFDVSVPDGRCGDVVAALDKGGSGLDLRITDPDTHEERAHVRGRSRAATRICGGGTHPLRGELRLASGQGDALVLTRLIPVVPPAVAARP
jgi:hypothetical protein